MERDNRKRTRDEESPKSKKPENDQKRYKFCDGIGVFDFPWLNEGVVFKADQYLEPEEKFAANLDQSWVHNSFDAKFHENKAEDDGFWSLQVDDLEPIDCIWSCVIDQPLDIGLNKAV